MRRVLLESSCAPHVRGNPKSRFTKSKRCSTEQAEATDGGRRTGNGQEGEDVGRVVAQHGAGAQRRQLHRRARSHHRRVYQRQDAAPDTGCLSVGEARCNSKAVLQEGRCEQYPVVILGYYSVSVWAYLAYCGCCPLVAGAHCKVEQGCSAGLCAGPRCTRGGVRVDDPDAQRRQREAQELPGPALCRRLGLSRCRRRDAGATG